MVDKRRTCGVPHQPDRASELQGARVIVTTGEHCGCEGVCLGKAADATQWAISPDGSDEILSLAFDKDFGLLVDLSSNPTRN